VGRVPVLGRRPHPLRRPARRAGGGQLAHAARVPVLRERDEHPALYGSKDNGPVQGRINDYVVHGKRGAVSSEGKGTKAAAHYKLTIPAGESVTVRCRLRHASDGVADVFTDFDRVFADRITEADKYFADLQKDIPDADARRVQRQAIAGLIWTKQFYLYDTYRWLKGDAATITPPEQRWYARNSDWQHFKAADVLSMPDKWEYPWFAAWDSAFHAVAFATFDPEFAKDQLMLLCREWYSHPNGQLPAYEWNFSDANPPVHAWATWRVFQLDRKYRHTHRTGGHVAHQGEHYAADGGPSATRTTPTGGSWSGCSTS
jgi:hypothetical protein